MTKSVSKVGGPVEEGAFEGDIFFGDPNNSTRGTHRWAAGEWKPLPSDAEVLMQLLAEARNRAQAAEERADKLAEIVKVLLSFGCPVCGGDCGSANPPVMNCPMQEAEATLSEVKS